MKRVALFTALLVAGVSPLQAQEKGSIEIGAFSQFAGSDAQTSLDHSIGIGGSIGYFLFEQLSIEGAAGYSWTDAIPKTTTGSLVPIRGRLLWNFQPLERVRPFIGATVVHNRYSGNVDGSDTGAGAIAGLRLFVNDDLAFRADAAFDRVWAPFNEGELYGADVVENHNNWMVTAGFSYSVGGTPRDGDMDGVPDRDDNCLTTPMGVSVDAVGCRVDSDGDGVFDEADSCASTPRGVAVDARGCRVDADGDGVFDEDDRCSGTPRGVRVDAGGCRVDADGDGVFDEDDQCSGTPRGVRVDGNGCRVDADGDGVFDEDDRCRNTPRGEEVDATGCTVVFEEEATSLVLEGVTFETSSATLTSDARTILDDMARALNGNPSVRIRVVGHTDSTGSRAGNVALSQARAESVAAYLQSQGVAANRMEAEGRGPDEPIADNATDDGRRMNRRVELERIN